MTPSNDPQQPIRFAPSSDPDKKLLRYQTLPMLNMTKTYESPHRSTYPRLATAFKSSTESNREPLLDYI
jgi:hypothetical protein